MTRKKKRKRRGGARRRHEIEKRAAFRFREKHVWAEHFRGGHRSMRVEWERLHKMLEELPLDDFPEYAQQWVWMLKRTEPADVAYYVRRGDFPYFDAWAHRFHILDETMKELGFGIAARVPFVYGAHLLAGLALTAERCFREAGGPERFGSAYASGLRSEARPEGADGAEPPG